MLIAGDIGGTKTLLGLFAPASPRPHLESVSTFVTLEHANLADIVGRFLASVGAITIESACFGVAGPVSDGRATLTNVPWEVSAADVRHAFGFPSVSLVNDLEAMAYAVPVLEPRELSVLQAGRAGARGNMAVIAAGTGLGEAMLHEVDGRLIPSPSEGGHADFSARNTVEVRLMETLTTLYGRAQWEHVLSGPGLVNLYRFTHPAGCDLCDASNDASRLPALISQSALEGRCPQCVEALDLFVSAYGAEAGNVALRALATGGVFLGGGIAPKIVSALQHPTFIDAFTAKPPMTQLLESIPVSVIMNDQCGLVGAAVAAQRAVR
ncbi:MAG: glucokinase [Bacteroidales bacterium]